MNFANLNAWHLFWLLPLIAAALHFFYIHREKKTALFIQQHLINDLAQGGFGKKFYRWKALLVMAAFVLMVIALSRPQWGFTMRPVKRHGLDIMVVIDTSKSMLTADVKPSRLERTKLAIKDLIMKLNGSDHIGLIAFAGNAMLMCPFTYDYNGFLLSLDDLSVDSIPRGGTDIAQAIDESIKAYQGMQDSDKAVVLITDGEDEEGDALAAARRAKEKGIKIFTVGVGTKEGDLIQVTNANGQTEFLKDASGDVVKSHLNENLLQQIAYVTGGAYIRSGAEQFGLDYLYDRQLSRLKKHDAQVKEARIYDERFQWPLTLAFLLLLAESLVSSLRAKRSNLLKDCHGKQKASLAMTLVLTLFIMPGRSFASVASDVNKANHLYAQGKLDDSLKLYQDALDQDDNSALVKYDLGTALYKKGDYAKARGYLEQAAADKNIKIKPKAEYNLGNVLYKSGAQQENTNVDGAIKSLQEALGHYGETLEQNPKDQDAQFNEDFVKKEIERLKQKKQQQQQQQQQQRQQQQKNQQNQQQNKQQNQQQGQQQKQNQQQQQESQKNQNQQNQAQQNQQKQQQQTQQAKQENGKNKQSSASEAQKQQQQLDRQQAEDLLEDYQENEEPKKLLNYMPKKIDDRPVLKDW